MQVKFLFHFFLLPIRRVLLAVGRRADTQIVIQFWLTAQENTRSAHLKVRHILDGVSMNAAPDLVSTFRDRMDAAYMHHF